MRNGPGERGAVRFAREILVPALVLALVASMIPAATAGPSLGKVEVPAGASLTGPVAGTMSTTGLQTEIDHASPGSTLHVPSGTYAGQLRVDKDLHLEGSGEGKTVLRSPAEMAPDSLGNVFVIEVGDHAQVQISELTVQVTEQCMLANSIGVATGGGIGVRDDSTLSIWDVSVSAVGPHPNLDLACTTHGSPGMISFGRAISIGLDDGPGTGSTWQVEGHGSVERVTVQGFDIFSISVGGVRGPSGSTATVKDNVVRVGPGPYTAAYGIVVYGVSVVSGNLVTGEAGSDGGIAVVFTSAVVTRNVVQNFICTRAPFPITPPCGVNPLTEDQDLGIFLASIQPGTIVTDNSVHHVDAGIFVDGPGATATIVRNSITDSTYYGLDLINANQTFRDDLVAGGLYAIAVGAANFNTTAILAHDTLHGFSIGTALLEAISPWVAKVVIRSH